MPYPVAACRGRGSQVVVAPVADFSGTPTSILASELVQFTDLSTGATSWEWDFGDGGTSKEQHPLYSYEMPGTYTVTLSINGGGDAKTKTRVDYIVVG